MRQRQPFARQASSFAQAAQREQASLRRDLNRLRDGLAGLQQAIKAPVPRGGSRTIKGTRTQLSALDKAGGAVFSSLLRGGVNDLLGGSSGTLGSFYTSSAQYASQLMNFSNDAQRIG